MTILVTLGTPASPLRHPQDTLTTKRLSAVSRLIIKSFHQASRPHRGLRSQLVRPTRCSWADRYISYDPSSTRQRLASFYSANAKLEYNDSAQLTAMRSFNAKTGIDNVTITISNNMNIKGLVNLPIILAD
jgi:hypothetical protein